MRKKGRGNGRCVGYKKCWRDSAGEEQRIPPNNRTALAQTLWDLAADAASPRLARLICRLSAGSPLSIRTQIHTFILHIGVQSALLRLEHVA